MTRTTATVACLFVVVASASAQQPPRPVDAPRSVTLTLTEYNRLIDLANRSAQDPGAPPVAAVLSAADLRVSVDRENARGTFTVNGEVLRPGVSRVNLVSNATLIDATAGGRPVPLAADGVSHTALLSGPGPFVLTLEWGAPLAFRPGRGSFILPVPHTGTARATFDVPGDQADVRLSTGVITRRSVSNGRTVVEATLQPGSSTEVSWSMRDSAPAAAAKEVRAVADVMTLLTIGDSDVRMTSILDVTVMQGEMRTLFVRLPSGYELTGVAGGAVDTSTRRDDGIVLELSEPAARSHQVLLSLERPHAVGSFTLDTGLITIPEVQRERGEVAVEGVGTLDLTVRERDGLQRIDIRELHGTLQALARLPVLSAHRYQRNPIVGGLALDVRRFDDASVLAAVADSATVSTLVTSEGRALTEVMLRIQNRAQPFLKVALPEGATMVSVEVAGEPAKPVTGTDGIRVPLLRAGFRPSGAYQVSFVYMHAGSPFVKTGDLEMSLPKMDIPIGLLEWEMFFPDAYKARMIGGNVLNREAVVMSAATSSHAREVDDTARVTTIEGAAGEITGRVTDASGAVLPGVTILVESPTATEQAVTRNDGTFKISGMPRGAVTVTASLPGFVIVRQTFALDNRPRRVDVQMRVGTLEETIGVSAESPRVDVARRMQVLDQPSAPSTNIVNLQRRVSGVLPVRVDVPRSGTAHRFVKPLVVDQSASVTLRYRRR
jgi:hypothetical protein